MFEPLDGGCLCGKVRYRVTAAPFDSGYDFSNIMMFQ